MPGTLSFTAHGITASVTFDRWDDIRHARGQWTWEIALDDGVTESESELRGPATEVDALRTLGHFLSAFSEASRSLGKFGVDRENLNLFPPTLAEYDFEHFCLELDQALSPSDQLVVVP